MLFKRLYHHCLIKSFTLWFDGPQVPLNLTVYSDKKDKVHMTWVSGFNGGLDQFFVISRKNGPKWDYVGNLTDPGNGSEIYFEAGSPIPGRKNSFRVESCNIFIVQHSMLSWIQTSKVCYISFILFMGGA